jgi:cobalt-zinc-cadmium efflux system outer membrane protein
MSLLLLGGCTFQVREAVDGLVGELASRPMDLEPKDPTPLMPKPPPEPPASPDAKGLSDRLKILPELPGSFAPPIRLPPRTAPRPEREAAIENLYQPLPTVRTTLELVPGPEGRPFTLSDLQRIAMAHNPTIRQAGADVEAARGAAVQAGLPPNPNVGYEGDTMNQAHTAGMQGAYIEQTIKTAGKLKLAQAAAAMDFAAAELALRTAQNDVMTQVRGAYFAVLVARAQLEDVVALARLAEEVYRIQIEQVRGDQAAPYEPFQLRVLAVQARSVVVQAQNRHTAAWKQLAAAIGMPGQPPAHLAGDAEIALPVFRHDEVLAQALARHTDVLTAQTRVQKARYNLRLAQVTPVPDVDLRVMVQKDFTTPPFLAVTSVQVGVPVPVWDRNQGNIAQAQANLLRSVEEQERIRNQLTARVAEAFERYENNRTFLEYYRSHILPDQVRTYRGIYERYDKEPERVNLGDIVTAQQTLATSVVGYLTALTAAWAATVDVASFLQTPDLFQLDAAACTPSGLDLSQLPPLGGGRSTSASR